MILTQADTMNSPVVGVLLGTLLGTALGKEAAHPPLPTLAPQSARVKHLFFPARKPNEVL